MSKYERLFNRYELKYEMPLDEARAFIGGIADYMEPDPFAGSDGKYRISSLYYDSLEHDFFWEKLEGLKFRRKLRVRRYQDSDDDFCMVEIKQRVDRTVQKRRVQMSLSEAFSVLPAPKDYVTGEIVGSVEGVDVGVLAEARYLVASYDLLPMIVINYTREAYQSCYSSGLRITIDSNLKCRTHNLDWSEPTGGEHYFLSPNTAVVEIKFNETVPRWLTQHVADFECTLERISKYCHGINELVYDRQFI